MTTNQTRHNAPSGLKTGSAPCPLWSVEEACLEDRLAAKGHWKDQPGHRYTPEQLKRMEGAANVTIHGRRRMVLRY